MNLLGRMLAFKEKCALAHAIGRAMHLPAAAEVGRAARCSVGVVLLVAASGCTSLRCRCQDSGKDNQGWDGLVFSEKYVYPGVEGDFQGIAAPWVEPTKSDPQRGAAVLGVFYCLFDLPFSLVVDTVCLPYDLYRVTCGGKTRSGDDRKPDGAER